MLLLAILGAVTYAVVRVLLFVAIFITPTWLWPRHLHVFPRRWERFLSGESVHLSR